MIILDKTRLVVTDKATLKGNQLVTDSEIFVFDPTVVRDVIAEIKDQLEQHPSYIEVK